MRGSQTILPGFRQPKRSHWDLGGLACLFFSLFFWTASSLADTAADKPIQVLLALDTSGSMKTTDPLRLLPKAAAVMVNLLGERDQLGLLRFDESPRLVLKMGTLTSERRHQCLRELARLAPRGPYTDIPAVLDAALKDFGEPTSSPRALILITDGQVDIDPRIGSIESSVRRLHEEIIPSYQQAKIAVFTVAFTQNSDQKLLRELAAGTRGSFLLVEQAAQLHRAFVSIYEQLKQPQLAPITNNRFLVDKGVEEAVLIASREAPDRPVKLENPHGQKIALKNKPGEVRWFASPAFDMATLPQPRPGVWTVSEYKEGEGTVTLFTNLTLICPHIPAEIASDEELIVGATIYEHDRPVSHTEFLSQTAFRAILTPEKGEPIAVELAPPPAEQRGCWPPGTKVGRYPPLGAPGMANLKVLAQGKTFQRERNFSIRVSAPWYGEAPAGEPDPDPGRLAFLPRESGLPDNLRGWVSVQPATGGVAATLFQPGERGDFSLTLPGDHFRPAEIDLRLVGVTDSGRPVVIRPAAPQVELPAASRSAWPETGFLADLKGKVQKLRARCQPVARAVKSRTGALAALALLLGVVAAGLWLIRSRWQALSFKSLAAQLLPHGTNEGKLLLLAQVETLQKEKAELAEKLDRLNDQLKRVTAETANLTTKLEKQSQRVQDKTKVIGELEKRLQEKENEAKAVQEEYTALYARSQEERGMLKKS